jgi:hypothetical protein
MVRADLRLSPQCARCGTAMKDVVTIAPLPGSGLMRTNVRTPAILGVCRCRRFGKAAELLVGLTSRAGKGSKDIETHFRSCASLLPIGRRHLAPGADARFHFSEVTRAPRLCCRSDVQGFCGGNRERCGSLSSAILRTYESAPKRRGILLHKWTTRTSREKMLRISRDMRRLPKGLKSAQERAFEMICSSLFL